MSLLLIGLLVWLGIGPAILALMAVAYFFTRSKSEHAVAPVEQVRLAAEDTVELDSEAA